MTSTHDIFLSYARDDDADYVETLHGALRDAGLRVWWDRVSMPSRALTFHHEIRRAIDESERVLVVLGPDAVSSDYVRSEWQYALAAGKAVTAAVRAGGMELLPPELKNLHAVDVRSESDQAPALAALIKLLREPVPPLAPLLGVPVLPPHFLPRPDAVTALSNVLLIDRRRPDEVMAGPRCMVVHGMSGSGKSTVAVAFARMVETRRAFPDGVVWLRCDAFADAHAAVQSVIRGLRPGTQVPEDASQSVQALQEALVGRGVLLVLDNARSAEEVAPFLEALDTGCRVLATTLDGGIATTLGAEEQRVDVLTEQQSAALLADWTGEAAGADMTAVIEECGGLPFALAIVGAMAGDGQTWAEILELLRERDLDLIGRRFPGYAHPHLFRALDVGVEALRRTDQRAADLYLDLAVFREGAVIPEDAIVRFWSRRAGLEPRHARTVLPVLERRALVQVEKVAGKRRIRLHTLQEDYLHVVSEDLHALHGQLVDVYAAAAPDGWASGPDDAYFFENLAYHLARGGRREALFALVDSSWIETQLSRTGTHQAAVADLEAALHAAAEEPVDVTAYARSCLLQSLLRASSFATSPAMIGLLAITGEVERALAWTSLQPENKTRFDALLIIASVLARADETRRARMVLESAVQLVPHLGSTIETGWLPELAQLAAVHVIVGFPEPEQWESTTPERVALARVPLEAVLELIPVLDEAGALDLLNSVRHPFWGFYYYLIPRVAAERLALDGRTQLARAVVDALRHPQVSAQGLTDVDDATSYRDAVAMAALGEHERAVQMIDEIANPQYRSVGYHRIAGHAALAGCYELALRLLDGVTDGIEHEGALDAIASAFLRRPDEQVADDLVRRLETTGRAGAAVLVEAAAGRVERALEAGESVAHDVERARLRIAVAGVLRDTGRRDAALQIAEQLADEIRRGAGAHWIVAPFNESVPEIQRSASSELIRLLVSLDRWELCALSLAAIPVPQRWSIAIQLGRMISEAGMMRQVLAVANEIDEAGFQALVLFNALLHTEDAQRDPQAQKQLLERLLDVHARLPDSMRGPLPLSGLLPILPGVEPPELALRILQTVDDVEKRETVRAQIALRSARAGDLDLARRLAVSFRPAFRPVVVRVDLAHVLLAAGEAMVRSGDEAAAERMLERCTAMLDEYRHDGAGGAAENDLASSFAALGQLDRAAALAYGLGGADPLEMLVSIRSAHKDVPAEQFRIERGDAMRITSLAMTQANALNTVASWMIRSSRAADAAGLAERARTLGSIAIQLGAPDEGRRIVIESLILAGATSSAFELLTDDAASILRAAKALVTIGHVDDALAIVDHALDGLRANPLGLNASGGQRIISTEQFYESQREAHRILADTLLAAAELASTGGRPARAAAYCEEVLNHTKHAPTTERVHALTRVAEIRRQTGQSEIEPLIAQAEDRLRGDPEASEQLPNPWLEIARAWAVAGHEGNARKIWLWELAQARFAPPSAAVTTLRSGVECLGYAGAVDAVLNLADMVGEVSATALVD